MEAFLTAYGYWAILFGTFLEGETILILGGLAAHQGYLSLSGVILAAFCGSLMGDQLFFYLGRRHGDDFLRRHPSWQPKLLRANRLIERFQNILILGFRFLYGLRSIMPLALGISHVQVLRFVLLNMLGAGLWSLAVGGGGYLFGHALEAIVGNLRHYEKILFVIVAVAGGAVWSVYLYHRHRRRVPLSIPRTDKEKE